MGSPESPYTSRLIEKTLSRESNRPPDEEIQSALARLRIPLSDADLSQAGEHSFSLEELGISFTLRIRKLAIDRPDEIRTLLRCLHTLNDTSGWEIEYGQYAIIESLIIEDKAGENTFDLVPANYIVYNLVDSTQLDKAAIAPSEKAIVIMGNPSAPETILSLLHEVGHIYAPQEAEQQSELPPDDPASRLFAERNTNAFVLNFVRKFVPAANSELRNAILKKINHGGLASYEAFTLAKKFEPGD